MSCFRNKDKDLRPVGFMLGLLFGFLAVPICVPIGLVLCIPFAVTSLFRLCIKKCADWSGDLFMFLCSVICAPYDIFKWFRKSCHVFIKSLRPFMRESLRIEPSSWAVARRAEPTQQQD
ncbi:hypothetical protein OROMI_031702 [Orobanche minor]